MANNREEIIAWCSLISGTNASYYERLTDEQLQAAHKLLMNQASDQMSTVKVDS